MADALSVQRCQRLPKPRHRAWFALAFVTSLAVAVATSPSQAQQNGGGWIATWSASPQSVWEADFFAPVTIPRSLRDQTVRQVARVSLGGSRLRIVISNEYGDRPLVIGAAHVGLAGAGGAVAGSSQTLTFGGRATGLVPPGAPLVSDPVELAVPALGSVAVSLYFPEITPVSTWHNDGVQTAQISAPGDFTADPSFAPAQTTFARLFLSEILVEAGDGARAVVLFGDSITDGNNSTPDMNRRWPDLLAERLHQAGAKVAVVNQGISGARILRDRMGDNALARFDRDVLSQPHADTVVVMMGINDIGWPDTMLVPKGEPAPAADDIIDGYKQLIARARAEGLTIIGATLTPFGDTFKGGPLEDYYTEAKEAKREAVNRWIRTAGNFDGVIDFDATLRDPARPKFIRAEFDSGDHLHPNDAGYAAMAAAVSLQLLGVKQ